MSTPTTTDEPPPRSGDTLSSRWTEAQKDRAARIVNDIAEDVDNPRDSRKILREALAIYADLLWDEHTGRSSNAMEQQEPMLKKLLEITEAAVPTAKEMEEIREYLWPNQTGLPNEHRSALVAIKARERLASAQIARLDSALRELYDATSCTTAQYDIIEKALGIVRKPQPKRSHD